jgi:hypothetical protein
MSESDKTLGNFTEKVQSVKKILNLWSYRDLTYCYKRTVLSFICVINFIKLMYILSDISEVGVKFLKYVSLKW